MPRPKPLKIRKKKMAHEVAVRDKMTVQKAKRIYELHTNAGLSYTTIATILHCARGTAHHAFHRYRRMGEAMVDRRAFNGRNNGR